MSALLQNKLRAATIPEITDFMDKAVRNDICDAKAIWDLIGGNDEEVEEVKEEPNERRIKTMSLWPCGMKDFIIEAGEFYEKDHPGCSWEDAMGWVQKQTFEYLHSYIRNHRRKTNEVAEKELCLC